MSIQVEGVSKRFGDFVALDDVHLEIKPGELVALLGPSGSGKTTLLRVIAGLESADAGRVLFDGEDTAQLRVQDRNVGFVFQHYALFRHMSIFDNVAFGLSVRPAATRPSRGEIRDKVHALLGMVQLDALGDRYPHQLSGGQRQRIALARALAIEPRVLLLDEPFGALDAKVRRELRRWLRRLHDDIRITSVFVTHDQEEALEVADRIVVFDRGRIAQVGTPDEVYDRPATPFVYEFLGHANRFESEDRAATGADGSPAAITFARPHEIEVSGAAFPDSIPARLQHAVKLGPRVRLELARMDNGQTIEAELPREHFLRLDARDDQVVYLAPRTARRFPSPVDAGSPRQPGRP
jgi:sulfate transport system ATP-binding protein